MRETPTIAAISTPLSVGAIGLVRLSGPEAVAIAGRVFRPIGRRTLETVPGYSAIYGHAVAGEEVLDEVVVFLYRAPRSYTGEDVVEFSCHGGPYLLQRVLRALLDAGVIDELSVVLAPVIDGGDGAALFDRCDSAGLDLIESCQLDGGGMWLRYRVN